MKKRIVQVKGNKVAVVQSDEIIIEDAQSALDFIATIRYEDDCSRIVLNKQAVIEDFFKLSTGIAGEILQKFVNYHIKIAIVGDFSTYTSKPLKDFIYECNNGNDIFFAADEQSAIDKISIV